MYQKTTLHQSPIQLKNSPLIVVQWAHPGGGVSGFPGHNEAHTVLSDLRTGKVNRY